MTGFRYVYFNLHQVNTLVRANVCPREVGDTHLYKFIRYSSHVLDNSIDHFSTYRGSIGPF